MLLPGVSWPGGNPEGTGIIIGVVAGAYLGALWLAAIAWTFRDIRERTRDPITQTVAVLMVMGFSFAGWVLYHVLRPGLTLAEVYERQLEEEALLQDLSTPLACPQCGVEVTEDYVSCPYCANALKEPCASCGRALTFSWAVCPWCTTPRRAAAAAASTPAPSGPQEEAKVPTESRTELEPPPERASNRIPHTVKADRTVLAAHMPAQSHAAGGGNGADSGAETAARSRSPFQRSPAASSHAVVSHK